MASLHRRPVPGANAGGIPRRSVAGEALFDGCLAVLPLPRAAVRSRLPRGLTLDGPDAPMASCLIAFGEHVNARACLGGWPITFGARYRELMLAVPCSTATGSWLFVLDMACDAWWAAWNGNVHYGFNKRLAAISWQGGECHVRGGDSTGGNVATEVHAVTQSLDPKPDHAAGDDEGFHWIQRTASMAVLGQLHEGAFVRSRFAWDFDDADVVSAHVRVVFGRASSSPAASASLVCEHGYRVRGMRWRLGWPQRHGLA